MTLSDDLDELDWEFRGTLNDEVQTGWFGKGITGLYNHSVTPKVPTPMTQFHAYAFDWTPERVIWEDDGAVVRTLYASDCIGTANQYPQTPMKAMLGLWDAGDPDHYDPWSAGVTPIPPPAGGYSFYVKSVKIWNNNPAACYNWLDHSGRWQSIQGVNDSSACGISPKSSATIISTSSAQSSSSTIRSSSSAQPSSSIIKSSSSATSSLSKIASSISATISARSSSSTAATSQSALPSSHQLSSSVSTLSVFSSSASSMRLAYTAISATSGPFSSIVSSSQISAMHPSSSPSSSAHPSSAPIASTQSSSAHPLSVSSPTSVGSSIDMSAAKSSTQSFSSTSQNAGLSIQTSVGQSLSSSVSISPNPQTSANLQTLSGQASVSSSTRIGSLTGSSRTMSATGSIVINSLSLQTGTLSNLVSSTVKGLSVTQSTSFASASHPTSSAILPTTTALTETSLLPTTTLSWRHTLTIIVVLPGPQTLSYNPVVGDLTPLIVSLEDLIHRHQHQSKRELAPVPAKNSVSVPQSGFLDAAAQRHHHGHQHDHLHDQLRRRSVSNESHAAPANSASASIAVGSLPTSTIDATTSGDEEATATAWTTGAASIIGHTTDQIAGPNANSGLLADGQDPRSFLERANDKAAAPRSLLAGQSAVSQATPAYLGASSTSVTAANTGTQSILQQHFSAAQRILPFGKSRLRLCTISFNLWAYLLVVLYQ